MKPFVFLCFSIIEAHNKMKKAVQMSNNSNPVAMEDTHIITMLMFMNCTGVWMIDVEGVTTDDLSTEVIAITSGCD